MNLGEEVYGKGKAFRRPVLVLRKVSGTACIVLPATSQEKTGSWYHEIRVDGVRCHVMLHQIRFITTKRFESRVASMPKDEFVELKNAAANFYGISQESSPRANSRISGESKMFYKAPDHHL